MRTTAFFCLFFLAPLYGAAESIVPSGCQPLVVQGEILKLQVEKNSLLFLHNLTTNDLWITRLLIDPNTSNQWTTRLQNDNWSALVIDKEPFVLHCIESKPGHEQQVPCEGALAVCQWKDVKIPDKEQGSTHWVAEDMSLAALSAAAGGRGFIMPAASQVD